MVREDHPVQKSWRPGVSAPLLNGMAVESGMPDHVEMITVCSGLRLTLPVPAPAYSLRDSVPASGDAGNAREIGDRVPDYRSVDRGAVHRRWGCGGSALPCRDGFTPDPVVVLSPKKTERPAVPTVSTDLRAMYSELWKPVVHACRRSNWPDGCG